MLELRGETDGNPNLKILSWMQIEVDSRAGERERAQMAQNPTWDFLRKKEYFENYKHNEHTRARESRIEPKTNGRKPNWKAIKRKKENERATQIKGWSKVTFLHIPLKKAKSMLKWLNLLSSLPSREDPPDWQLFSTNDSNREIRVVPAVKDSRDWWERKHDILRTLISHQSNQANTKERKKKTYKMLENAILSGVGTWPRYNFAGKIPAISTKIRILRRLTGLPLYSFVFEKLVSKHRFQKARST